MARRARWFYKTWQEIFESTDDVSQYFRPSYTFISLQKENWYTEKTEYTEKYVKPKEGSQWKKEEISRKIYLSQGKKSCSYKVEEKSKFGTKSFNSV